MTARRLAAIGALAGIGWALGVGLIASQAGDGLEPPELVPRGIALAVLFGLPGILGLLGAAGDRRVLLIDAGVLYLVLAPVSFGGVTLLFAIPGLLLLRAGAEPDLTRPDAPVRPLRLVGLVAAAIPVAAALILLGGILALLALVIVAAVAPAFLRRGDVRPRSARRTGDFALGVAVFALAIAAVIALFGRTETVCWTTFRTPAGYTYQRTPVTNTLGPFGGPGGPVGGGCAGGRFTPEGVALSAGLAFGAVALAAFGVARSRHVS